MSNYFHKLFNPHCPECSLNEHYLQEKLSLLLEQERAEKFRLLQLLAPSLDNSPTRTESVDISTLRRNPKSIMRDLERKSQEEYDKIRKRAVDERISEIESEAGLG